MVDAQPRDDGREIRARGADVGVLVLTRPDPRVLHDILGFAGAAEHSVRNREQQRSMRLERGLVPVSRCHGSRRLALLLLSDDCRRPSVTAAWRGPAVSTALLL